MKDAAAILAQDAKAIVRKIEEQQASIEKWKSKADGLEAENKTLRTFPKAFSEAQETIDALEDALAEAKAQAQLAESSDRSKTVQLATSRAEIFKLESLLSAQAEEETARRRVADLVGGSL